MHSSRTQLEVPDLSQLIVPGPWFICFDRDGTLAELHESPQHSRICTHLRSDLYKLAELTNARVCVLSARSARHLRAELELDAIAIAGNYGLEILLPGGGTVIHESATDITHALGNVASQVTELTSGTESVIVENHGYSLCIHYHRDRETWHDKLRCLLDEVTREHEGLSVRALPTSYEVMPNGDWTKYHGISFLYETLALPVIPIQNMLYIGDSEQDEPAFRWVNERGGISLRVGKPKSTLARFVLPNQGQVHKLIKALVTELVKTCHV